MKFLFALLLSLTSAAALAKTKYDRNEVIGAKEAIQIIKNGLVHDLNVGIARNAPCAVSAGYHSDPETGEVSYQVLLKNEGLNTQYFTFPVHNRSKIRLVQTDFRTWEMSLVKQMETEDPETGRSRGKRKYEVVLKVDNRYPDGLAVELGETMILECRIK